jgi:hypothetical protein
MPIKRIANGLSRPGVVLPLFYAAVFLGLFGSALFSKRDVLLSPPGGDLAALFVPLRVFAAEQLRAGHIPLWNPHIFCGMPFAGDFQSALFYPLTWLHLVVGPALAINWTIAISFFLAAWFTALCCRYRNVGIAGSLLGGLAYALSGAFYFRFYAGNLAIVETMTWMPLLLLCIDRVLDEVSILWCLIGGLAVALMLLAGSPPSFYNTALIFAAYTAVRFIHVPRKPRVVMLLALMGIWAAGLSAIQVLPGVRATQESVRATGTSYDFAIDGPFPPENILTLFSARIWGDNDRHLYTGRSYMWEASLYIGTATTLLAAAGMVLGPRKYKWPLILSAAIAFILALGVYAQIGSFNLFRFLFNHFPMYNRFRTTSRFGYQVTLCLAILASMGVDEIVRSRRRALGSGAIALVVSFGMGIRSAWLWHADPVAAWQFALAAGIAAAVGILAIPAAKWRISATAIAAIAVAELISTAVHFRFTGPLEEPIPPQWTGPMQSLKPDERILHCSFGFANRGMIDGTNDIYGYHPMILKRYAQLLAASQGQDPDSVDFDPHIFHPFGLLGFMRCRYILFNTAKGGYKILSNPNDTLPRLQLIDSCLTLTKPHEVLSVVNSKRFDPSAIVILESSPTPAPMSDVGPAGDAELIGQTTDTVELRANVARPCILVMSDCYSLDWRARPLDPGPQSSYSIMPANYAFMAIPLSPGKHHVQLEYHPSAWKIGLWITAVALPLWFMAVAASTLAALSGKLPQTGCVTCYAAFDAGSVHNQ